jgi:hypothetical protein
MQQFSVHADVIGFRVGLGAEFGYDLSVDFDQAGRDHIFGFAPRGNSGSGNDFL